MPNFSTFDPDYFLGQGQVRVNYATTPDNVTALC